MRSDSDGDGDSDQRPADQRPADQRPADQRQDDQRQDDQRQDDQPPALAISSPEQFKALAHPLRQRLLFVLGQKPATISQLAVALGARKGNVAHHLKVLREAGMVAVVETRKVRGGTEQYYERTTRTIDIAGQHAAPAAAMLTAVAQEFALAAGDPLLALRHLHLTAADAQRLTATLMRLIADTRDAGAGEPRYGLLVSLYQQSPAGPADRTAG
jgi:DNA-binding transcriptional ArsR family regulator